MREIRHEDRPSLYCIELRTTHRDDLVRWYRHVLGLRVRVRVTDDRYALLEAGESRLSIIHRDISGDATPRISLAFELRDLQSIASRLKAEHVLFAGPTYDAEGLREINTADPDGNCIRLFSWPR